MLGRKFLMQSIHNKVVTGDWEQVSALRNLSLSEWLFVSMYTSAAKLLP